MKRLKDRGFKAHGTGTPGSLLDKGPYNHLLAYCVLSTSLLYIFPNPDQDHPTNPYLRNNLSPYSTRRPSPAMLHQKRCREILTSDPCENSWHPAPIGPYVAGFVMAPNHGKLTGCHIEEAVPTIGGQPRSGRHPHLVWLHLARPMRLRLVPVSTPVCGLQLVMASTLAAARTPERSSPRHCTKCGDSPSPPRRQRIVEIHSEFA